MPTPEEIKQIKKQTEKDAILKESKDFATQDIPQQVSGELPQILASPYDQGLFQADFVNRKIRTVPVQAIASSTRKFMKLHPDFLLSGVLESISSETQVLGSAGATTLATYTIPLNSISRNYAGSATSSGSKDWRNTGNVFRITASGMYTTDDGTSTVAIACKVGSTTYHTITTTAGTISNAPWRIEWVFTVKTIGASGKAFSYASAKTNNVNKDSVQTTAGGVTIDTTVSPGQAISLTATWSSGDSGDSITIRQFLIELLN